VADMYTAERRELIGQSVFSKDDKVSMDFVHCAANLRMENYRINRISRWEAQSVAGAIIPAVASTNAIVAGLEGVQLIHVIEAKAAKKQLRESRARTVWVRYPEPSRKKILQPSSLLAPNENCFVCGTTTARVTIKSLTEWKINAFAKAVIQSAFGAHKPAIYRSGVCIYDPEYPEASEEAEEEGMHPEWSLAEWDLASGAVVQVEDEGQGFSCNVVIIEDAELSVSGPDAAFPAGFRVDTSVDAASEVAKGDEKKRKAEAEAAEAAAAKKANTETVDIA